MLFKTQFACCCYALFTAVTLLECTDKQPPIVIIDDVLMLNLPARGLESSACTNFLQQREFALVATDSQSVAWSEGRALANDTIRIIRLEMHHDTGVVARFTMTLRPQTDAPSEIQCMKGFGCDGPWEIFPWKSPNGNFLDHTTLLFQVLPRGASRFTIFNKNPNQQLQVKVNPPI